MALPARFGGVKLADGTFVKGDDVKKQFEHAFNSISHPLHPAAETCLSFNDFEKTRRISFLAVIAAFSNSSGVIFSVITSLFLSVDDNL